MSATRTAVATRTATGTTGRGIQQAPMPTFTWKGTDKRGICLLYTSDAADE